MGFDTQWVREAQATVGGEGVLTDPTPWHPTRGRAAAGGPEEAAPRGGEAAHRGGSGSHRRPVRAHEGPLTARGGGTGLSGGCVPSEGAIVLSLERLNRVIESDPATATITVEAGVPLCRLYEEVDRMGLFFPPHPGDEGAFVGGVVATNAGGARAVEYGTIRRFVLGLRAITASGAGRPGRQDDQVQLGIRPPGPDDRLGGHAGHHHGCHPRPRASPGFARHARAPVHGRSRRSARCPPSSRPAYVPCAVEFVEHSAMRCSERRVGKEWPARSGARRS